ncbi:MAG: alpha-glucosidase, partial [Clostridia bacterium]|nr:alpha-glucosidase [Clostridia bacterium]
KEWWHGKVAYQIYPKSFCDSNGDGIGDLEGIRSKLDVLKSLGVDIIWLSPMFKSPFADEGYDISDNYSVDPHFGTLEDMDALIADAKARDMSIILDLVVNHCSDEHEWFKKACEDPEGPYGKFFYIFPHKRGTPMPTNWRSFFGGSVWDELPGRDDYVYLHVFHKKQPDLNWENPQLRLEIYKMINWWLDRGIAGFRLDAIINIKKAIPFESYPADREDGTCSVSTMLSHANGVLQLLGEMKQTAFAPHKAFTIAELVGNREEDLPLFIGDDGCFSTIFDFAPSNVNRTREGWYNQKNVTLDQYKEACFASQCKAESVGFMANIIENHDQPRGVTHYLPEGEHSPAAKKMLGGLSFMLRGLPFLYQGQELGMENTVFPSLDVINDCGAQAQYDAAIAAGLTPDEALAAISPMCRDNARTPYQWNSQTNAGFTTGKPWLPVNPNYTEINYAAEIEDPNSVWYFYQRLASLRHSEEWGDTVVYGKTEPWLEDEHGIMAYFRRGSRTLLVLANLEKTSRDLILPSVPCSVLMCNDTPIELSGQNIHLFGYQFIVLVM